MPHALMPPAAGAKSVEEVSDTCGSALIRTLLVSTLAGLGAPPGHRLLGVLTLWLGEYTLHLRSLSRRISLATALGGLPT